MKAHDYPDVYEALGINLNKCGCVMMPLETIDEDPTISQEVVLYRSPHPERHWINGWVAARKCHVTLLYGLLDLGGDNVHTDPPRPWRPHALRVLEGWDLSHVVIDDVGYFPSPYPEEKYWCIHAKLLVTKQLLEGHQRLSLLPHINTFPEYTPHVTIAYIKDQGEVNRDHFIRLLIGHLNGRELRVTGPVDLGRDVGGR